MKSKFVSLIVAIAVVLAMVAVPAVPGMVAANSYNVTMAMEDGAGGATIYANPLGAFSIYAVIDNPDAEDVTMHNIQLDFDNSYFTVDSVTLVDFPLMMGTPAIDNVNGTIGCDPYFAAPGKTNAVDITSVRINCTAKALEGVSTVSWVYTGGPPPRYSKVIGGPIGEDMTGGDMSKMFNGTVIIGSPKLTVDVSPAGKGDVSGFGPFPDVSNQSWWAVIALDAQDTVLGWTFDSWSGDIDLAAATNPNQVTMSALSRSVTANFVEMPCDLDVDPNTIPQFKARLGVNEDSGTVTISNLGGHTLCWQVGTPPTWSVNDSWTYWNSYSEYPPGTNFSNPYYDPSATCLVNDTQLVITVTGEDADNYYAFADWPLADPQRTSSTTVALCMHDASVTVDKCTMDYVHQHASLSIVGIGPAYADVSWVYNGCHGWPYYLGKAWSYNMRIKDPVTDINVTGHAMVTAGPGWDPTVSYNDCYTITHFLNPGDIANTTFMQQWWSDTARNFVYQWDGGTFNAPPLDIRALLGQSIAGLPAPACCDAPSWLSFDQMAGDCGIGESDVLTVTANSSGLAVGTYNGSFCISGCCGSVDYECVNVSLWVQPATTLTDLVRDLPADRLDYDAEYPGDSFFVYVNFSSLGDDFNSIGVTDYAPAGWLVETNNTWCVPPASYNKSNYNKAEYAWAGAYNSTATFSAKYKVTIPATASPGSNFWPECSALPCPPCAGSPINNYPAWVDYWNGADGPFETMICEEREKVVTVPGCETGETRDVLGNVLDTVTINLYEDDDVWEDQDTSSIVGGIAVYEDCADDTGYYYKVASKYCYFTLNTRPVGDGGSMPSSRNPAYPDYVNWSTPELLAAGNVLDFVGDYGLVCKAASMSMAMEAVNHMLFTPEEPMGTQHPDWQLSGWKVSQVVHAWQFPCGCNC